MTQPNWLVLSRYRKAEKEKYKDGSVTRVPGRKLCKSLEPPSSALPGFRGEQQQVFHWSAGRAHQLCPRVHPKPFYLIRYSDCNLGISFMKDIESEIAILWAKSRIFSA